jgi:hypothetical protein
MLLECLCDLGQKLRSFPAAQEVARKLLPLRLTQRQLVEQIERVGLDVVERQAADVLQMQRGRGPTPPGNAPDVLVIGIDGGRLQDRRRPAGDRWCEYKLAVCARLEQTTWLHAWRADPQPKPHWRYDALDHRVESRHEKTYDQPRLATRTYTASTADIDGFIPQVELEAQRRGVEQAREVAVVGDGGPWIWRTAREICAKRRERGGKVTEILDLLHAESHLVDAAKALAQTPCEAHPVAWLNARHGELWAGKAEALIAKLTKAASAVGPRPPKTNEKEHAVAAAKQQQREANDPLVILWRCVDYFTTHQDRIRYDLFRKRGLPLTSSHVESSIKQANHRVKGSEKSWRLHNADAMLALRCLALSEDGRWNAYFDAMAEGRIELPTPGRRPLVPTITDVTRHSA